MPAPSAAAPAPVATESVARWSVILGAGFFAVTLAQPALLDLPIRKVLKDELGLSPSAMATFIAVSGALWYFKPLAGLLSDAVPLFGTRRKHYLIVFSLLTGAFWLAMGLAPRSYGALLAALIAVNGAMVMVSSVLGGLLVEAEQRLATGGRLVSVRVFVESFCVVVAGPLSGLLAGLPFAMAAAVGAAIALTVVPVVWLKMQEAPARVHTKSVLTDAYADLGTLVSSRPVWATAAFLLIASVPQGNATVLFYHQTNALQFSEATIGWLKACTGVGSVLASLLYGFVGRRLELRALLAIGLAAAAAGVLAYVFYRSLTAAVIVELVQGFLLTFTGLALMEAAVWATPKGVAAMGFAVLMSALNAGIAVGDVLAAVIIERWPIGFYGLMQIYGVAAVAMLGWLFLLPKVLFVQRDARTH